MKSIIATLLFIVFSGFLFSQKTYVDTIFFNFDKDLLTPESEKKLDKIAQKANQADSYSLFINAHTDSTGTDHYNDLLSKRRGSSAVRHLKMKGLDAKNIRNGSYGEKKPTIQNINNLNRRVELVLEYDFENKNGKEAMIAGLTKDLVIEEKLYNNTELIELSHGVQLELEKDAFEPHKIDEVRFEADIALNVKDALKYGWTTMDASGNGLSSDGMIDLKAFDKKGNLIQPDKEVTIRIPADDLDKNMKLYEITENGQDLSSWKTVDLELQYVEINGQKYYEFRTKNLRSFNVDKPVICNPDQDFVASNNIQYNYYGLNVKSRKYKFKKTFLTSEENFSVIKGKRNDNRKKAFYSTCTLPDNVLVATFKKDRQHYIVVKHLDELKYKKRRDIYIIRKKDYLASERSEIADILAQMN